jgi:alkylation response protein AidB-like acyl-CoA dehydrogenase
VSFRERLLTHGVVAGTDLSAWWRASAALREADAGIERALLGGAVADRLGFAFAAGYQAALEALWPPARGTLTCLCATEAGGNHPRAIQTTLERRDATFLLSGEKRWATLAPLAQQALVVARAGERDGRPQLLAVRVSLDAPGVSVAPMAELQFVPEIPHATVGLSAVRVEPGDVLPGDGYTRYLKPFRTLEDLHVQGALIGYLLGAARRFSWPASVSERLLALAAAARDAARDDPLSPALHLALAGLLRATEDVVAAVAPHWAHADAEEAGRWERDRPLLAVAASAREARRKRARERFSLTE